MNIEFMCGLLANYSKELSEAETYLEKGDVQLKHAKLILDKVKNCSIPDVIKSVCECKVCGKPFVDKLSLYEHYDEEHNKQTDL